MYDLEALRRREFPLSSRHIYFNHAAISPLPSRTRAKLRWAAGELGRQPTDFFVNDYRPAAEALKAEVARLLNATAPDEIVPITTTSAGLGAVAHALHWQAGDNVLFCEYEFPSNAFPWLSLERYGVETRRVPADNGGLTLDSLKSAVDSRTRLVAVSSVQFFSGHRTDLEAIGAYCRQREILFAVDAIQSIGHIPIDVEAMHIDVLASGGQKSIMALPGVGVLYIRAKVCAQMTPIVLGPTATVDFENWLGHNPVPLPGAGRFTMGTGNALGIIGLLESVRLLVDLGIPDIDRHTASLAAKAIEKLAETGYQVITPAGQHGPIVTFRSGMSVADTEALVAALRAQNVTVVGRLDAEGRPHLRLSFHCYNTEGEISQFMDTLRACMGSRGSRKSYSFPMAPNGQAGTHRQQS